MTTHKRLIICSDGTWQDLQTPSPTNVVRIAQAIAPADGTGVSQIVYYDPGVGSERGNKLVGGAFGRGLDDNIAEMYRFLALNYCPGDELFLFGFSRGAYTVRSLAGLIYNCGIPARKHLRAIPAAYELYRDRQVRPDDEESEAFRARFSSECAITALCCWDTVGSLGIPDQTPFLPFDTWINRKYAFHDVKISPIIRHAFHAVALDERRKVFDVTPMELSRKAKKAGAQMRQLWFCGDHGAVGGGDKHTQPLADIALEWMIAQTAALGLAVDSEQVQGGLAPDPLCRFDNEVTGLFRLTGEIDRALPRNWSSIHDSVHRRLKKKSSYQPRLRKRFTSKIRKIGS
jgi:uncharacterized protein (DUF2235 family)